MKNDILIATNNPDKLLELKALFSSFPLVLHSLIEYPHIPPTVEDKSTIAGNAMKKAVEAARESGMIAIADDTGLFIDALNGEPGVYAARFAGENCSYKDNRWKALDMLQGNPNRKASFRTAMAMAAPEGIIAVVEGCVDGQITEFERGESGFGYDSIFEINGVTYAEMDEATKNSCSHRAEAVKALLPIIENLIVRQ